MLPIEPRLKPLGATIIHYADETKGKFTRCHSFSGYVPYFLAENVSHESERNECEHPELCRSNCSSANVETDVGEASPVPHVWPDTDEEGCDERSGPELRGPGRASAASSESGDSEEFKSRLNSKASVWPNQSMWSEDSSCNAANAYDSAFLDCGVQATYSAWGAEMWEMPSWPERPTPIGEKVMEGFGKALRKAVGEVPSKQEESCFHSTETSDIEDYIWHLHRNAGCRPVCFVYAFVYICRMSELNAGKVELSQQTCHRLLLAAITIAAKLQQPNSFDARVYAAAGNVTVPELEILEAKLTELLQWNLDVCAKSFKRIFRLLSQAAC